MGSSLTVVFYRQAGRDKEQREYLCRKEDGLVKHTFSDMDDLKKKAKELGVSWRTKPRRSKRGTMFIRLSARKKKPPAGYSFCRPEKKRNRRAAVLATTGGVVAAGALAGGVLHLKNAQTSRLRGSPTDNSSTASDQKTSEVLSSADLHERRDPPVYKNANDARKGASDVPSSDNSRIVSRSLNEGSEVVPTPNSRQTLVVSSSADLQEQTGDEKSDTELSPRDLPVFTMLNDNANDGKTEESDVSSTDNSSTTYLNSGYSSSADDSNDGKTEESDVSSTDNSHVSSYVQSQASSLSSSSSSEVVLTTESVNSSSADDYKDGSTESDAQAKDSSCLPFAELQPGGGARLSEGKSRASSANNSAQSVQTQNKTERPSPASKVVPTNNSRQSSVVSKLKNPATSSEKIENQQLKPLYRGEKTLDKDIIKQILTNDHKTEASDVSFSLDDPKSEIAGVLSTNSFVANSQTQNKTDSPQYEVELNTDGRRFFTSDRDPVDFFEKVDKMDIAHDAKEEKKSSFGGWFYSIFGW